MELEGELFSTAFLWLSWLVSGLVVVLAVRLANWKRLFDGEQSNVFFGSCVALLVLWSLRTGVYQGLEFHLFALTTLTLMFGWSLSILGGLLVLFGVTLTGQADWQNFAINLFSIVVIPVTFTQFALVLIRYWFPKHFFIYIYLNAFLSGGIGILLSSFFSSGLLVFAGVAPFATLWDTYLTFFPLLFFPEAVLNGWFMTLLVGYKPQWVGSFRDEEYLYNK